MFRTVLFLSCVKLLVATGNFPASRPVYGSISLVPLVDQAAIVQKNAAPGVDYPVLERMPVTSFSCKTISDIPYNHYFADPETGCQVFIKCSIEREIDGSYLCKKGQIFDEQAQLCKPFHNVQCFTGYLPVAARTQNPSECYRPRCPHWFQQLYAIDKEAEQRRLNSMVKPSA